MEITNLEQIHCVRVCIPWANHKSANGEGGWSCRTCAAPPPPTTGRAAAADHSLRRRREGPCRAAAVGARAALPTRHLVPRRRQALWPRVPRR